MWSTGRSVQLALALAAIGVVATVGGQGKSREAGWKQDFDLAACTMKSTGRGEYFVLEPGFQLVLEGGDTRLQVTVMPGTRRVAGVETREVEEREWKDGALYEVSRNYFALCEQTNDAFYFGEEVDYYEGGKVVKHDGAWLAGEKGNRPGLIMPGTPKVGMRYYQEIAPGVAMDRAQIVGVNETCRTPAGTFNRCLKVRESSPLEPGASEYKYHAPGIGLVRDEDLVLVKHGFVRGD